MPTEEPNPTDEALQAAVDAISTTDQHLAGSVPRNWVLIVESEWNGDEEGGRTFSIFRSDLTPWEHLGLLRFATLRAEDDAMDAREHD